MKKKRTILKLLHPDSLPSDSDSEEVSHGKKAPGTTKCQRLDIGFEQLVIPAPDKGKTTKTTLKVWKQMALMDIPPDKPVKAQV